VAASRYDHDTLSNAVIRVESGQTMNSAVVAPTRRIRVSNRRVSAIKVSRLSGKPDGPCCRTTTSHAPSAMAWAAAPSTRWSPRL
jgi:hypothetical protein